MLPARRSGSPHICGSHSDAGADVGEPPTVEQQRLAVVFHIRLHDVSEVQPVVAAVVGLPRPARNVASAPARVGAKSSPVECHATATGSCGRPAK